MDDKEQRKLERLEKKVKRQIKLNNSLNIINALLAGKKPSKEKTLDDYLMPWEKELIEKKGYEPIQIDEEESELEDDDWYEKGED